MWLNCDSKSTMDSVKRMELYARFYLWQRSILGTQDVWPVSKGRWRQQLVTAFY